MTDTRAVVLATTLAVVAVVGMTAPFATAASVGSLAGGSADSSATRAGAATNGSTNSTMGTEISAFMQSSSASADGSVDDGMFGAAYNDTNETDRAALVNERTETLEKRAAALETRKERLIANEGNMSDVAYQARMSALVSRIEALYDAINRTATFANESGANVTKVETLRSEAANLTGPEVSRIARNVSGVTAPGEPADVGPPGENETGPPNGTPGDGAGNGNGDDGGQPDDPGGDDGNGENEAPGKDDDEKGTNDDDGDEGNGNGGQGNGDGGDGTGNGNGEGEGNGSGQGNGGR